MKADLWSLATGGLLAGLLLCEPAQAEKSGGVLRVPLGTSPASMSIHEESTVVAERPVMGVFNNLILFDQHVSQNSPQAIVPELATGWVWNEDGTELTFPLRQGVKWHDGKPFTAKDVKCTWDMLAGKSAEKFRINPRKAWYRNLEEVTTNGDYEVTFHLKRPQPGLLMLLASGWSPDQRQNLPMDRSHPRGVHRLADIGFDGLGRCRRRLCHLLSPPLIERSLRCCPDTGHFCRRRLVARPTKRKFRFAGHRDWIDRAISTSTDPKS